jgi:hypothetical protein
MAGLLLAAATSVLMFAWWTGVASAATTTGTLEICKSGDNGAGGASFDFTVSKGQNVVGTATGVVGGNTCGPVLDANGQAALLPVSNANGPIKYKIAEANTPNSGNNTAWNIVGASSVGGAIVSTTSQLVTATLSQSGGDTAVTVTNAPQGSAVKVCKTTGVPAFVGKTYTFAVSPQQNGVTSVSATAGASPNVGSCQLIQTQQNSTFTITENAVNPPEVVAGITKTGKGKLKVNGSTATVTAGAGLMVVTFDNEAKPSSQLGLLEICKDKGDQFITGSYQYSIQDGNQTYNASVTAGQCTSAINGANGGIPAGSVTVTETVPANQALTNVFLGPNSAGQLGNVIKSNGSAIVVVPVASAGDVQVHFVNSTLSTQLKVCKFLPAGSEALQGKAFTFTVTDDMFGKNTSYTVTVTVPKGASSACTIVTDPVTGLIVQFPLGSKASVTESNSNGFIDAGNGLGNDGTQSMPITSGIKEIDFTNVAYGQLEICKYIVPDSDNAGQTFTFKYQNTAQKSIKGTITTSSADGNNCSFPVKVPVGSYTITEDLSGNVLKEPDGTVVPVWQFVASDARGPDGESRCVPPVSYPQSTSNPPSPPSDGSAGCGNPLTVTVPYFNGKDPNFGETEVSVWNRLLHGSFKICKVVDPNSAAALGNGNTYTFTASSTLNGVTTSYGPFMLTVTRNPDGSTTMPCTGPIGDIPLMNTSGPSAGTPTSVTVTETTTFNGTVESITVGQGVITMSDNSDQFVTFDPTGGTSQVIFTNGQGGLTCFSGTADTAAGSDVDGGGFCQIRPDGVSANINTTTDVCTVAQTSPPNYNCYAGVYYVPQPMAGELIGQVHNLRFSYSGGIAVTPGAPRFSIPIDIDNNGTTEWYAFADGVGCGPGGTTGTVDVINNPSCSITTSVGTFANWAAFVAAHPTYRIATDAVSFVIADTPWKGIISNVVLGP